jgi:hypothetical protein
VKGPPFRDWPAAKKQRALRRTTSGRERVWLVLSHVYGDEEKTLFAGLASGPARRLEMLESRAPGAVAALFVRDTRAQLDTSFVPSLASWSSAAARPAIADLRVRSLS